MGDTSGGQTGLLDTSGGHTGLLDTSGAEELSVKTLADMFDFRLGEQPTKPPLSKSKDRLLVAKMSELAKVSSNSSNSIRRCQEGNDIEHIVFSDCSEC